MSRVGRAGVDHQGRRYGSILVLGRVARQSTRRGRWWEYVCDCGFKGVAIGADLQHKKACPNCTRKQQASKVRTHGMRQSPEYITWTSMIQRCTNTNNKSWPMYGGKGISVCERWRKSFECFYADMGARPSKSHSLDRIDCNLGYAPENCRWATVAEQQNNRRSNVFLEYNNKKMTLKQWADFCNLPYSCIKQRYKRNWTAAQIIETPYVKRSERRSFTL